MKLLYKKYLLLIIILAFFTRIISIKDNQIFFYFDQARDATISQEIIKSKDFKIMGPSVSGTNDSVYHGVFYYYLIAPIYYIAGGNPLIVSIYLAIINLFGVYITYLLGKNIFKSKTTGLIAAYFQSISIISIQQSTWLSNPNLSGIFLPLTYYLLWKILLSDKKQPIKTYIFLGGSLALLIQSALQNITIFGSVILLLIFSLKQKTYKFEFKKIFISIIVFITGIFSMILTEFLMYKREILSIKNLNLNQHQTTILEVIPKIISKYVSLTVNILSPYKELIVLMILLSIIILYFAKLNKKQLVWSFAFFTAPIWLLVWQYRDPNHTFIGIEIIIFLLLSQGIKNLLNQKIVIKRILAYTFIFIFTLANIKTAYAWRVQSFQYFGIQKGAFLNYQLATIDKTYQLADKKPFSFSTLTSPYLINTTWNYLYKWYGQKKYGYLPSYVGIDQTYFVGNQALPQKEKPDDIHFVIIEPDTTLSDKIKNDFLNKQRNYFDNKYQEKTQNFGTVILMSFIKKKNL